MQDLSGVAKERLAAAGLLDDADSRRATAIWALAQPPATPGQVGLFGPLGAAPLIEAAGARRLVAVEDAAACDWVGALGPGEAPAPGGFARLATAGAARGLDAIVGDDLALTRGRARLRLKPVFDGLLLAGLDYVGGAALFRRAALSEAALGALADGGRPAGLLAGEAGLKVGHLPYPALIVEDPAKPRLTPPPGSPPRSPAGSPLRSPGGSEIAVSVVVPNRDSPALMRTVAKGVLDGTRPSPAELIVTDNGSTAPETLALYQTLTEERGARVDIDPAPFNFSAMVNRGAALAQGDAILLLNNDVEVIDPDWLAHMVATLAMPDVGVVGAKLLFPDRTIQHAGVIVGHGGVAGHDMKGAPEDAMDPLGRMAVAHQRSAVTAACMLIRRETWEALGGFDERAFAVAFNDVDFCLRARAAGWRVALEPRAVLVHHESVSRRGPFSLRRFLAHRRERAALRRRHGTQGLIDPFESPWRDHDDLAPNFRMLPTLPEARV